MFIMNPQESPELPSTAELTNFPDGINVLKENEHGEQHLYYKKKYPNATLNRENVKLICLKENGTILVYGIQRDQFTEHEIPLASLGEAFSKSLVYSNSTRQQLEKRGETSALGRIYNWFQRACDLILPNANSQHHKVEPPCE